MQWWLLGIGILLTVWSFLSELYFHYVQRFTKENVCNETTFWRAEKAEVFNSLFLLILGATLIVLGFVF